MTEKTKALEIVHKFYGGGTLENSLKKELRDLIVLAPSDEKPKKDSWLGVYTFCEKYVYSMKRKQHRGHKCGKKTKLDAIQQTDFRTQNCDKYSTRIPPRIFVLLTRWKVFVSPVTNCRFVLHVSQQAINLTIGFH